MSKLVLYNNELLFRQDIKSKLTHEIGHGSEGVCYEYDNDAYKILFPKKDIEISVGIMDYMIHPETILTTDYIDLPSFAFPKEIYATKDWLLGYKAKLIKNNLFNTKNLLDIEDLKKIDFNALAHAYKIMLGDVDLLSEERIKIYDLTFNLVFDGKKLTGIDTCGYKLVNKMIKKQNRDSLSLAIEDLFSILSNYEISYDIENNDIDDYLEKVYKKIK